MPNPWFKFYGMEYLGDPKIETLQAGARSCWITLLCFASEHNGIIPHLSEHGLMVRSGLEPTMAGWDDNVGVLSLFKKLNMIDIDDNGVITVLNWQKRQNTSLTAYERVKRFREKKRMITDDNAHDNVVDKIREDKKRIDKKKILPTASGGREIEEIIFLFKEVNPLIQRLYGSPPQRKAVERMLKVFPREKLESMIKVLPEINKKQFWPKSTTPVQLESNIAIYKAKNEEDKQKSKNIIGLAL